MRSKTFVVNNLEAKHESYVKMLLWLRGGSFFRSHRIFKHMCFCKMLLWLRGGSFFGNLSRAHVHLTTVFISLFGLPGPPWARVKCPSTSRKNEIGSQTSRKNETIVASGPRGGVGAGVVEVPGQSPHPQHILFYIFQVLFSYVYFFVICVYFLY